MITKSIQIKDLPDGLYWAFYALDDFGVCDFDEVEIYFVRASDGAWEIWRRWEDGHNDVIYVAEKGEKIYDLIEQYAKEVE